MYLAFGATRMEACKPMATDALRLALAPIVNRMRSVPFTNHFPISHLSLLTSHPYFPLLNPLSHFTPLFSVLGIISIPGMMTGAILGGSSVEYAARLQVIIIFMISASTTLAAIVATGAALAVVVDSEHRVREDRMDGRPHIVYRATEWVGEQVVGGVKRVFKRREKEEDVGEGEGSGEGGGEEREERQRLLE